MNSEVAIIMTAYNEEEQWITECIESLLNQTYDKFKLYILLDNPNNNELKKILESYQQIDSRIILNVNEKNIGLVESLNKLLDFVSESYIARMDADDICDLTRLEKEMLFLIDNNLDFVMSNVDYIVGDEIEEGQYSPLLLHESFSKCEMYGNISTHPTWLLKKEVYKTLDGYRNVKYCEDYDFVLRAIQHGFKVGKLDDNLLHYRVRNTGISKTYAYEQYYKSKYLRECFRHNIRINELNVKSMNSRFDNVTDIEKEKFIHAKTEIEKFTSLLYAGRYFKCVLNMLKHYIISSNYRDIFNTAFINNILIRRVYKKSVDYLK